MGLVAVRELVVCAGEEYDKAVSMESGATGFSGLSGSDEGHTGCTSISQHTSCRPTDTQRAKAEDEKESSLFARSPISDAEDEGQNNWNQHKPAAENPLQAATSALLNGNNENQQSRSPEWRDKDTLSAEKDIAAVSDTVTVRQGVVRLAPGARQAMKLEAPDASLVLPAQHVEVIKTTPKHLDQLSPIKEEPPMTLNFGLDQTTILADLRNMPPNLHYADPYGSSTSNSSVYAPRVMYTDPINSHSLGQLGQYQIGLGGHGHGQSSLLPPNSGYHGLLPPQTSDPYGYRPDTYYSTGVRPVYPAEHEEILHRLNQHSLGGYPKPVSVEMPSPVDSGLGQELIVTPSKPDNGHPESYIYTDMSSPSAVLINANSRCTPRQDRMAASSRESPVHIPKLTLERGFQYTLEAPVSTSVRKEDDKMTYINKGQFYTVVLDYIPDPNKPLKSNTVKSFLMLVFRDDKPYDEELKCWSFWHQRQHSAKQRIMDVDTKNCSGVNGTIDEISHNGIQFYWNPTETQVKINVAVQCLSTDFSNQKGVKGFPLHLQIDTYDEAIDANRPFHRGYCQIKVFCDKGANRKMLHEQRRDEKRRIQGRKKSDGEYHDPQERSEFYHMSNLDKKAVLFSPPENGYDEREDSVPGDQLTRSCLQYTAMETPWALPIPADSIPSSAPQDMNGHMSSEPMPKRSKVMPVGRVMIYVRKPEEQVFTPLHLIPPSVEGLVEGLCEKYGIQSDNITGLYRQCRKGVTVKIDDDMLRHYCNEDTFLLQLMADNGGVSITLSEMDVSSPL